MYDMPDDEDVAAATLAVHAELSAAFGNIGASPEEVKKGVILAAGQEDFDASLVLASEFLLNEASLNQAWTQLGGLETLEVGKCEHALGTALNWRLWVSRKATRKLVAPIQTAHNFPPPAHSNVSISPPLIFTRACSGTREIRHFQASATILAPPIPVSNIDYRPNFDILSHVLGINGASPEKIKQSVVLAAVQEDFDSKSLS
ncbi:hypothetical protein FRC12_004112 [Ceratobasidium sp. 428]|nr:hypothetical protein FRC12_004112 [Ceratobasidium sp. 428]